MGYSEPYSALLTAVAARLVNGGGDSGPFTTAGQVQPWIDSAVDEFAPSAALLAHFSKSVPTALVCDGGNDAGDANSDGVNDEQLVNVWFGSAGPTVAAAMSGDGDEYWGIGALKDWIVKRLANRTWSASGLAGWDGLIWQGTRPVNVSGANRAIMRAVFRTTRLLGL